MDKVSFDIFFQVSLDLMCVAGLDGYFKRVNPAFTKTLGYSEADLVSLPFIELIHPDDRQATQAAVQLLASGQDVVHFENRYRCQDGSWKWLAWATPAPPQGSDLLYAVARDITRQKHDAAEREILLEEARRALEQLRQLDGVIPICSFCKKIRGDRGEWEDVEHYIARETGAQFSGSYCPSCVAERYPELLEPDGTTDKP